MPNGADQRYLLAALALIAAFMTGEVAAGLASGSLVLLADAGHMLTDAAALAGSVWAARLAARPAGGAWTFGLKRAEILSAAANGVALAAVALVITVEAVTRLIHPPPVAGAVVLAVALAGVAVNLVATWVLSRASRSSLNVRGAFVHILTDLYAFAGTAAAGVVILATGGKQRDAEPADAPFAAGGTPGQAACGRAWPSAGPSPSTSVSISSSERFLVSGTFQTVNTSAISAKPAKNHMVPSRPNTPGLNIVR